MNKKIIIVAVVAVGIAFYGGFMYGKSITPSRGQLTGGQFTGNQNGARGAGMMSGIGGGFTAGEIISKNETSITLKMQDGSTKIVLVGGSAQVTKSTVGSLDDLTVGTQVTVTGSTNSDKSVTAQSIQIRPAGSAPLGGTPPITQ